MTGRNTGSIKTLQTLAAALAITLAAGRVASAQADEAGMSFPDWSGQWVRIGSLDYPPEGHDEADQPPLSDEYRAKWERNRALHASGIPAGDPTAQCLPPGMPRLMKMRMPMEVIVTPDITYVYGEWDSQLRRIYTDGREFPGYVLESFNGYSLGEWRDDSGNGVYDTLTVETRFLAGPRYLDETGLPLHANNGTVVHEEIRRAGDGVLENRITVTDDALTRPWTINQQYSLRTEDVVWEGHLCAEHPRYLQLGDYWYIFDPASDIPAPANESQPQLIPKSK